MSDVVQQLIPEAVLAMPVLYLIWCVILQAVLRIARLHDDLLSAKDPVLTLRVAAAFCTLAVLSNIFRCQTSQSLHRAKAMSMHRA